MSKIRFKFDKNAILKAVEPKMRDVAAKYTRDYERMRLRLQGKPLDEIKSQLMKYHKKRGGEISDPELTQYAEELQQGERIVFRYTGKAVG